MSSTQTTSANAASVSRQSLLWNPARWFLAFFGAFLLASVFSFFLGDDDVAQFALFLRGQVGLDAVTQPWFWKTGIGFVFGFASGYFGFLEIPKAYYERANRMALALTLFLVPLMTYIPAMSAGFLWDDDQEISQNPSIVLRFDPHTRTFNTNWKGLWEIWTGGITNARESDQGRAELGKAPAPWLVKVLRPPLCAIERDLFGGKDKEHYYFQGNQFADYFPVKSTTLWIEYQLCGYHIDPQRGAVTDGSIFHIMTIIFHALDCLLLWSVLRRLNVPGAWLGALLFGIHPVHSESVAWIAERKNTLSLLFVLLSMRAWLTYDETGNRRKYYVSLALFVTALLCKTHVVVFPAVLMLTEWWRKGNVPVFGPVCSWAWGQLTETPRDVLPTLKRDLARYVPLFVVTVIFTLMTVWFQNDRAIGGEVIPIGNMASRIAGAGIVTWLYLGKALLPINLNTIYANTKLLWWPLKDPAWWMFLAGALIPLTLLALLYAKKVFKFNTPEGERTPFYVFAFFVGTLTPVLGLCTMSYMRLTLQADHFQYFSDIAIVAAIGTLVAIAYRKLDHLYRPILVGGVVTVCVLCCMYSWERAGVHQSEETLWRACLKKNEASWQAHNHMGAVLYGQRKIAEAGPHFARAVELKPENPEVHNNLGLIHWYYGRYDQAIEQYRESVRIKGEVIALRHNLADALLMLKRFDEGLKEYDTMIKDVPNDPNLRAMKSGILAEMGRYIDARKEAEIALRLDPNNAQAKKNLEMLQQRGF